MRFRAGQWIFILAGGIVFIVFLNVGISFLALKRLERNSGSSIGGRFLPGLFWPAFTLKDPTWNWRGRFQVQSGHFHIRYDPSFLLPGKNIRVQIAGEGARVGLFGELAQTYGLSEIHVDEIQADVAFSSQGKLEIFSLDLRSPEIQFHFGEKEASPR